MAMVTLDLRDGLVLEVRDGLVLEVRDGFGESVAMVTLILAVISTVEQCWVKGHRLIVAKERRSFPEESHQS